MLVFEGGAGGERVPDADAWILLMLLVGSIRPQEVQFKPISHFPSFSDDFKGVLSGSHHEWFVESIDISFEHFWRCMRLKLNEPRQNGGIGKSIC